MNHPLLKFLFHRLGLEITHNRNQRISLYQAINHLRNLGYLPSVIVDAGVASGTPALYTNYPQTKTILIEPLDEYNNVINEILKRYPDFHYVKRALSDKDGLISFYSKEYKSGSSEYLADDESTAENIRVESITLEQIIEEYNISSPALLKLDIEGSEKKVLLSSTDAVKQFNVIICEVTFIPRLNEAPAFAEIQTIMTGIGYCVFDIVDIRYEKNKHNLFQADIVYIKKDSPFRQQKNIH